MATSVAYTSPARIEVSRTQVVIIKNDDSIICHVLFCNRKQLRHWLMAHDIDPDNPQDQSYALGEIGPFGKTLISGHNTTLLKCIPFALALSDAEGCGNEFELTTSH